MQYKNRFQEKKITIMPGRFQIQWNKDLNEKDQSINANIKMVDILKQP